MVDIDSFVNHNIMGKFHTISGIIAWVFIIVLLFILIHPFDLEANFEQTYHSNEGLIWLIGIVGIVTANLFLYLNGIVQRDNKKCIDENLKKNKTIEDQNNIIIENQLKYIDGITKLNDSINENTKKDLETLRAIQIQGEHIKNNSDNIKEIQNSVLELSKSIVKLEKYNGNSEKRLEAIEKLIKIHNSEIDRLKKYEH